MGLAQTAFEAIGTHWKIELFGVSEEINPENVFAAIQRRIAVYDKNYSRFRDDSLIVAMSKKAGAYILPEDGKALFDLYRSLYDVTNGLVTPLIGQLLVDAGYDATYTLVPKELGTVPSWTEALDYDYPQLLLKQPVLIDVGAAGKGYCVDLVGLCIESFGITSYVIDAGGDILCKNQSQKPLRVGLENPLDTKQVIGVAEINNQSICGSAGNRRTWAGFNHIFNPKTKTSATDILATWVVADSGLLADGLATALFFVEPEILIPKFTFDYLVLYADSSFSRSQQFPGEIFS